MPARGAPTRHCEMTRNVNLALRLVARLFALLDGAFGGLDVGDLLVFHALKEHSLLIGKGVRGVRCHTGYRHCPASQLLWPFLAASCCQHRQAAAAAPVACLLLLALAGAGWPRPRSLAHPGWLAAQQRYLALQGGSQPAPPAPTFPLPLAGSELLSLLPPPPPPPPNQVPPLAGVLSGTTGWHQHQMGVGAGSSLSARRGSSAPGGRAGSH